jgi:hypothetical protein
MDLTYANVQVYRGMPTTDGIVTLELDSLVERSNGLSYLYLYIHVHYYY